MILHDPASPPSTLPTTGRGVKREDGGIVRLDGDRAYQDNTTHAVPQDLPDRSLAEATDPVDSASPARSGPVKRVGAREKGSGDHSSDPASKGPRNATWALTEGTVSLPVLGGQMGVETTGGQRETE